MRRALFIIAAVLLAPSPAPAQTKLGVGFFAPEVPFDPAQRFAYVRGLAQHLGAALGTAVEAHAYKSAADFDRDVHARKIQLAVVGAVYLAGEKGWPVIAVARLKAQEPWSLLAREQLGLADLKGKVLQIPGLGPLTSSFVENALLGGVVELKKHCQVRTAPDLGSALAAVQLGRADAVLAPIGSASLKPVVKGGVRLPPPAFVATGRLAADLTARVRQAVIAYSAGSSTLTGWQPGENGPYTALAAASTRRQPQMVLAAPGAVRLNPSELVDLEKVQVRLPELEDLFWVP